MLGYLIWKESISDIQSPKSDYDNEYDDIEQDQQHMTFFFFVATAIFPFSIFHFFVIRRKCGNFFKLHEIKTNYFFNMSQYQRT